MTRFILPIILIGIAVTIFFTFTNPIYNSIDGLKATVASYDQALSNSKALEVERDKLTAKSNTISLDSLDKLEKLLPENVDNIRLILEIEKLATPYGMSLKDVKYESTNTDTSKQDSNVVGRGPVAQGSVVNSSNRKDYGSWDLEFSTTASYNNFISFLKDLENNLRLVDVASIEFSSTTTTGKQNQKDTEVQSSEPMYNYNFKITTYWLKN